MNLRRMTVSQALVAAAMLGPPMPPPRVSPVPLADSIERSRAIHVMNRLAYGARPGDVDRIVKLGVDEYIRQQLHPENIDDSALERRLDKFKILKLTSADLAEIFREEQRSRRQAQQRRARSDSAVMATPSRQTAPTRRNPSRMRRLTGEFQQIAVVRATMSQRQLYEVMVDFWTNHFNVFLRKGPDRFLTPDYIEHAIRPRALGSFEDLLIATAKSPAMLFYLDNAQSVAPGSQPPQLARARERRAAERRRPMRSRSPGQRSRSMRGGSADSDRNRVQALERRLPTGINENYARELLELHTLGVEGGYTQQDVIAVARILTGWSAQPYRGGEFIFNEWAHDRGTKVVLGHRFAADRGMDEGMRLLRLLASHPATLRHVSSKLCARFVNDDPPAGCIDAAVRAWESSDGDIRSVVEAIVRSPDFWALENRRSKTKTPLEFVGSAVRALDAEPDTSVALAQVVGRLGQPLYLSAPPTGYPESQESWINSGALLQRFNVAMGLAAGRLPGVLFDPDALFGTALDGDALVQTVNSTVLNGMATEATLSVMREQVTALTTRRQARAIAIGLALGSPEFQRQ